jgi:hypothetical protein
LLPLAFFVWLLFPSYKEEQTSVRIPFFDQVAAATGLKPATGLHWVTFFPNIGGSELAKEVEAR